MTKQNEQKNRTELFGIFFCNWIASHMLAMTGTRKCQEGSARLLFELDYSGKMKNASIFLGLSIWYITSPIDTVLIFVSLHPSLSYEPCVDMTSDTIPDDGL